MADAIVEELKSILAEDYAALASTKYGASSEYGEFRSVHIEEGEQRRWFRLVTVVTKTPDDRYFQWSYDDALTENQESVGPGEYGEVKLTQVYPREVVITKTVWDTNPS